VEPISLVESIFEAAALYATNYHEDVRGLFGRLYCPDALREFWGDRSVCQVNLSSNPIRGTIRGLHFQHDPWPDAKLVRCLSGEVLDVIVDLRQGSPTFLQHRAIHLTPESGNLLFVPEGFAHGFQSLLEHSSLLYIHSARYDPGFLGGLRYDDPILGIKWPLPCSQVSERDLSSSWLGDDFQGLSVNAFREPS